MSDSTVGLVAVVNKGGRSFDVLAGGAVPLARVRLDASLPPEEHQEVVRRLAASWNALGAVEVEELERGLAEGSYVETASPVGGR